MNRGHYFWPAPPYEDGDCARTDAETFIPANFGQARMSATGAYLVRKSLPIFAIRICCFEYSIFRTCCRRKSWQALKPLVWASRSNPLHRRILDEVTQSANIVGCRVAMVRCLIRGLQVFIVEIVNIALRTWCFYSISLVGRTR